MTVNFTNASPGIHGRGAATQQFSDASQIAALDAVIMALRSGHLPRKSECEWIAERLGSVRDRVASTMAESERKATDQRRSAEIAGVYREDRRR